MSQLDLFHWAEQRPTAQVIDILPRIIKHICAQPHPFPRKDGKLIRPEFKRERQVA
jgi:hypothetical protein